MLFKESYNSRVDRLSSISDDLHKNAGFHKIDGEDHMHLKSYTSSSASLNKKLLAGRELFPTEQKMHDAIHRNAAPFGRKVVLYSGTGVDFGSMAAKSPDFILHSPAHISASHHFSSAQKFAKGDGHALHMLRITAEPHHKGLFIGRSDVGVKGENETILPSGTNLQYIGTTTHATKRKFYRDGMESSGDSATFRIHHFHVHSQKDAK